MKQFFAAVAFFATLACAAPASADDNTAVVSGRFTDYAGHGIAGATVDIRSTGQIQQTTTDRDGYFIIFDARPGEFRVSAAAGDMWACVSPIITVRASIAWNLHLRGSRECRPMPLIGQHLEQLP